MQKRVFPHLLLILISMSVQSQITVGEPAIPFVLPDTSGDTVSLQDFTGQIILLNFFATWCPPCQVEAPQLEDSIWQIYRHQGITVIGIDFKEPVALVQNFIQEYQLTYPILLDSSGTVFQDYGLSIFPSNILIDREGKVVWVEEGFNIPRFINLIDSLLSVTSVDRRKDGLNVIKKIDMIGVYPNPFNGNAKIFFRMNKNGKIQLKIYDTTGRLLVYQDYFFSSGEQRIPILMAQFSSGIYFYTLQYESEIHLNKFVYQK